MAQLLIVCPGNPGAVATTAMYNIVSAFSRCSRRRKRRYAAMTQQERYDLVLLNGRVMDPETHLDALGSVGIQQGKITAVSREPLAGREVIDATGLVVAPGFIDVHTHGQTTPSMRMQAFDGVTTTLELEAGSLPISLAYEVAAREGRPLNYGFSASWALAHMSLLEQIQLDGTVLPLWANLGTPSGARWCSQSNPNTL